MSEYCLFTGEELNLLTDEEHTILKSLGGRITSKIVSSSTFNHKCGGILDAFLYKAFAPFFKKLSPAMPGSAKSGDFNVEVFGDKGDYALDDNGVLMLRRARIDSRDSSKRIASASIPRDKAEKWLKTTGLTMASLSEASPTESTHCRIASAIIAAPLEIAALKCALLTFDHVLASSVERFTRMLECRDACNIVRDAVLRDTITPDRMNQVSLGIQYQALPVIHELRRRVILPEQQFEHVLVASANQATRTLDVVWNIAGFEPYGFRVLNNWRGSSWTCILVNQILLNGQKSAPHFFAGSMLNCRPNNFRSYPEPSHDMPSVMRNAQAVIVASRSDAINRAVWLVEQTCDEFICSMLKESAAISSSDHSIGASIARRCAELYSKQGTDPGAAALVESTISNVMRQLPGSTASKVVLKYDDNIDIECDLVLSVYRQAINALEAAFGRPDIISERNSNAVLIPVDGQISLSEFNANRK